MLVVHCGPLSSNYDRACELFYSLKGGVVNYGETHSKQHNHSQYGESCGNGLYPDWNEDNPIHLVGHSLGTFYIEKPAYVLGANTVLMLQTLLEQKAFAGYNTNAKWIKSITTISGNMNGTTTGNILGMNKGKGFRVFSFAQIFATLISLYEWLDIKYMKKYVNLGLDHYNLSWRKTGMFGRFQGNFG